MGRSCVDIRGAFLLLSFTSLCHAEEFTLHTFQEIPLTDEYYSEGVGVGDLNGDQIKDVVYGPLWFSGPDYQTAFELAPPVPQNRDRYADRFFSWVYDFDGDGWNDVLTAGFPGTPAYVYQNPGTDGHDQHWTKHEVFDWVSNESPQFVDLVGDSRPELVCTRDGYFGFVTVNWDSPFSEWKFHQISERVTAGQFGHGLGVGDVNGDGLKDILYARGWLEQPSENALNDRWMMHDVSFTKANGGADMFVDDVDGDGDGDVITSHAAHDFGLGWYEQIRDEDGVRFEHHLIMGEHPAENTYGLVFSELHSVALADMNGDGLKDIITGKTFYSHHKKSPMWDTGAVVYWFERVQTPDGVEWIPHLAGEDTGIGRQLMVDDVNGDQLPDIIVGGMKGSHVLIHQQKPVSEQVWKASQPKRYDGPGLPNLNDGTSRRGPKAVLSDSDHRAKNADEVEDLPVTVTRGKLRSQPMTTFRQDRWSGDAQVFWTGGQPGDVLSIPIQKPSGNYQLEAVFTCAPDYGVIEVMLNGNPLGQEVDLFDQTVKTTGVLKFPPCPLTGDDTLTIRLVGANPRAKPAQYVGLDFLRWTPITDSPTTN